MTVETTFTNGSGVTMLTLSTNGAFPSVNYVDIFAGASTQNTQFTAKGSDTNIGLSFQCKGNWFFGFHGTNDTPARIRLYEQETNGSNSIEIGAPASLPGNYQLVLPSSKPTAGQALKCASVSGDQVFLTWA